MRIREQRDAEMAQAYCRAVGRSDAVVKSVYSGTPWECWLLSVPPQEGAARIVQLASAYLSGMYAERDRAEKGAGA